MQETTNSPIYIINDCWTFNPNEMSVQSLSQTVSVRKKNADVLLQLLLNPNRTVTSEALYQAAWGDKCVSEGVLKRSICELRNVLGDDDKTMIVTVPKQGYRLAAKVVVSSLPEQSLDTAASIDLTGEALNVARAPSPQVLAENSRLPLLVSIAVTMILTVAVTAAYFNMQQSQPTSNNDEYYDNDVSPIFIHEVMNLADNQKTKDKMLANLQQKLESLDEKHPEREILAQQLVWANLQAERFNDVIVAANKLLRDNEKKHGPHHIKTIKTRRFVVDALLSAGQIQSAYDMAQMTIQIVKEHHFDKTMLLALSHYQNAQVNLSCVYPFCDRFDALNTGLSNINLAIGYYQTIEDLNPVLMADALLLKNWFIKIPEEKRVLVNSALKIYLENFGNFSQRIATAYSQLAKIERHWYQNYTQSARYFNLALDTLTVLFDDQHESVKALKYDLAGLYLDLGEFEKTIALIEPMEKVSGPDFQCQQRRCLSTLMILAKAYFYTDKIEKAKNLVALIKPIIDSHESSLPFSLQSEILALDMRLKNHENSLGLSLNQMLYDTKKYESIGLAAKNDMAIYTIILELQHRILVDHPTSLDLEKYLLFLDIMLGDQFYSYTTMADRRYLFERATKHCHNHSAQLCQRIKEQQNNEIIDFGPWQKFDTTIVKKENN